MAQLNFVVLAENVIVDSQSNMLSIINIIERINTSNIPSLYPGLYLISVWEREKTSVKKSETVSFRTRIKYKSGKITEKAPIFDGEIKPGKSKLRVMVRIQSVPIEEEGTMIFLIEEKIKEKTRIKWRKVGFASLEVRKVKVGLTKKSIS